MSTALARRELALERKLAALSLRQRASNLAKQSQEKIDRFRGALEKAAENRKTAVFIAPVADLGGKAAEALAKQKLTADTHKYVGPAAAVGSIVLLTLAATSKKASEQQTYLGLGEFCVGASSRFVINQLDQLLAPK